MDMNEIELEPDVCDIESVRFIIQWIYDRVFIQKTSFEKIDFVKVYKTQEYLGVYSKFFEKLLKNLRNLNQNGYKSN